MAQTKKTTKSKAKDKEVVKKTAKVKVEKKEEKIEDTDSKKKQEYLYAVGKRKTSIALSRVYKKGTGKITVNDKKLEEYFPTSEDQEVIKSALKLIGQDNKLDISVKVFGGGVSSQAQACRHGISKALIQLNPNFRKPLKKAGYLKRDARKKERKKPGLKRARRAPQWKKR